MLVLVFSALAVSASAEKIGLSDGDLDGDGFVEDNGIHDIEDKPSDIGQDIKDGAESLKEGAKSGAESLVEDVKDGAESVKDGVSDILEGNVPEGSAPASDGTDGTASDRNDSLITEENRIEPDKGDTDGTMKTTGVIIAIIVVIAIIAVIVAMVPKG